MINKELQEILKEASRIVRFHKTLGIKDYPATDAFKEKNKSFKPVLQAKTQPTSPVAASSEKIIKQETQTLQSIQESLDGCERCELHKSRKHLIFGEGNSNADLMIIGSSPSAEAEQKKTLYADEPGKLLINMLKAINLTPDDVYYTTLVKCKSESKVGPSQAEIRACLHFLVRQVEMVSPKIIWTIGAEAAQTLLKSSKSLFQLRGQFHEYNGIPLMATFHPEALLQNKELKKPTWTDMQMIQRKIKGFKQSNR